MALIASGAQGQIVAFPAAPVGGVNGNPTNQPTIFNSRAGVPIVGRGGYAGDLDFGHCQWGPCSYNTVTRAIWRDVISCSECAGGGGGRYKASLCDNHQGVSTVLVAPAGYILADNYLGRQACNAGPVAQAYKIVNGTPQFAWGPDISLQAFIGFVGQYAYVASGFPCTKIDMNFGGTATASPCPLVFDRPQQADPLGRLWTLSGTIFGEPVGIKVVGSITATSPTRTSAASPTRTMPFPTVSPTAPRPTTPCPCLSPTVTPVCPPVVCTPAAVRLIQGYSGFVQASWGWRHRTATPTPSRTPTLTPTQPPTGTPIQSKSPTPAITPTPTSTLGPGVLLPALQINTQKMSQAGRGVTPQ